MGTREREMEIENLAIQYLCTFAALALSFYFFCGYAFSIPQIFSTGLVMALKLLNPGWFPRALAIVNAYFSLTLRGSLRMWVKHVIKVLFIVIALSYCWSTLSVANRDDPYTVIGATASSSPKEIRKLCRRQSLKYHPDKHPGQEDEVRPLFERVARACKTLNDPKKRAKFERFGIVESEEVQGSTGGTGATAHLGWFTTALFYLWVLGGVPVALIYNYSHVFTGAEGRLASAMSSAEGLHNDMMCLYKYSHFGVATLDFCELYLHLARWELEEQCKIVKQVSAAKTASKLRSLCEAHDQRMALWLDGATDDEKNPLKKKLEAANKKLETFWLGSSSSKTK